MANADYIPSVLVSLGPTEHYPFLMQHATYADGGRSNG